MPKPTFANLPAAKRETILRLALEEFAEHPYAVASLSRIVERAGIAKGSMYQYFEDKRDLYLHLLDHAAQRQLALLGQLEAPAAGEGFFELLRRQMSASMRVGLAAPELTRLMYRAVSDDLPFRAEVERRLQRAGAGHLGTMLAEAQARGELDADLDLELAAFMVGGLLSGLRDLILRRAGATLGAAADNIGLLDSPETERVYDQVIAILRHGLAPRRAQEHL